MIPPASRPGPPPGGALAGARPRVLICTDLGGQDADDIQSLVYTLLYSDGFDTEGLVSSPPYGGRARDLLGVIDRYAGDWPHLRPHGPYPKPEDLRAVVRQGAPDPAPAAGFGGPTDGSVWIAQCARRPDPRPLHVLAWGGLTDLAQALHDAPDVVPRLRVHAVCSWNRRQDPHAFRYVWAQHPDLWLIRDESTFRGWYRGGDQRGDYGNRRFVARHVAGRGELGACFARQKRGRIKMGDAPTVARLLRGDPEDPAQPSWGGRFVPVAGRTRTWTDDPDPRLREGRFAGARSVSRHRRVVLDDWKTRLERLPKKDAIRTRR